MKKQTIFEIISKNVIWVTIVGIIVAIDQITKSLVVKNMDLHDEIIIFKNYFNLYYVRNKGAGLGLFANARWVFLSLTIVIIIVAMILLITDYFKHNLATTSLIFIVAGGIGNMIDRVFLGEVIDFLQFQIKYFDFIFNVADIFVTFGTVLFIIYYIFIYERQSSKSDNVKDS